MSEQTQAEVASPEVPEVPDSVEKITLEGVTSQEFDSLLTSGKKGKAKGKVQLFIQPFEGETLYAFHMRVRQVVGEENYDKCCQAEVIRRACLDATTQAIQSSENGQLSDVGFSNAFTQWFLPATRRSGVHIKDLREKAQEIFSELNPLLLRHFQFKPGQEGSLNEAEHNRMLQLTLEYSDLNTKIEEKSRKGKTAKK